MTNHVFANPAVAPAETKLNQLRADLSQTEAALESAVANRESNQSSRWDRAAWAFLGFGDSTATASASVAELTDKVHALRRAIEIQTSIRDQSVADASSQIAEAKRPEYLAIVKRGAKALAQLRQYIIDEREFRGTLATSHVRFTNVIRPMGIAQIDESDIDSWLIEAKKHYEI